MKILFKKWSLQKIITAILTIIIAIGLGGYLWIVQPFKVTDPSDPRFNINHFRFSDYTTIELRNALKVIMPIGTSQEEVDHIFVEIAGTSRHIDPKSNGQIIDYGSWSITPTFQAVIFDHNKKLINIYPVNGAPLYPDQPTREDIWNGQK